MRLYWVLFLILFATSVSANYTERTRLFTGLNLHCEAHFAPERQIRPAHWGQAIRGQQITNEKGLNHFVREGRVYSDQGIHPKIEYRDKKGRTVEIDRKALDQIYFDQMSQEFKDNTVIEQFELPQSLSMEVRGQLRNYLDKLQFTYPGAPYEIREFLRSIHQMSRLNNKKALAMMKPNGRLDQLKAGLVKKNQHLIVIRTSSQEFEVNWNELERLVASGRDIRKLEERFDIMSRKASHPQDGFVHEVDLAFSSGGLPFRWYGSKTGQRAKLSKSKYEKVFALGADGSINFSGQLSNRGGERYYSVIMPKGFFERYGLDLRPKRDDSFRSGRTPNHQVFSDIYSPINRMFIIRREPATNTLEGQIHIHARDSWNHIFVDNEVYSQVNWLRSQALGVVEFNNDGRILSSRLFKQEE